MPVSPEHEHRLEQYVVSRGLVTEDELKEARRLLNRSENEGRGMSLTEALVRAGGLTESQARRVSAMVAAEPAAASAKPGEPAPPAQGTKDDGSLPKITVPGIQLIERIGRGSQAIVYKGRQVSVDRIVAVKVMLSKGARDPQARQRFVQEARAAAKLSHNNIVQAIDAGETQAGYPYFIQEFIDGTTVFDLLKDGGGPLPEGRALEIVIHIAEALAHAHSRGFIHRDVKPKNIMLTKEGVAKLADMGLARQVTDVDAEEVGKAFGTPYYIAPEQVLGSAKIDFRADIYSLGATFYEMLTGRPPFTAQTPQQVMQKHVTAPLTPPDHVNKNLSAGVSEVVEVMMAKRPDDRYKSTEDLLVDLRAVARGEPPRIARERVDRGDKWMEQLAEGKEVRQGDAEEPGPPPPPPPFAVNQLTIILIVALAVSVLLNIVQLFI
jgi:serine/threonine-protein kinase